MSTEQVAPPAFGPAISDSIYHLEQGPETNFEKSDAFLGRASEESVTFQGRKYLLIDRAIAVQERMISARAEKWLSITIGVIGIGGAIGFTIAAASSSLLFLIGSVASATAAFFAFKRSGNVAFEDAASIAQERKDWDPNKRSSSFSDFYKQKGDRLHEVRKFFTNQELSFMFNKEFANSDFSLIAKKVHLDDAVKFMDRDLLAEKWYTEVSQARTPSITEFFHHYDRDLKSSLTEMNRLGLLTDQDWLLLSSVKKDFDKVQTDFDGKRSRLQNQKDNELYGARELKKLKVQNAHYKHDSNWAVILRRQIMINNAFSDSSRSDRDSLINAGLTLAAYLAAISADRALEEDLITAGVQYETSVAEINRLYAPKFQSLNQERKAASTVFESSLHEALGFILQHHLPRSKAAS